MMLTQSGYQVIPAYGDPRIKKLIVGGVSIAPGVLDGDVWTVMQWVATRFHTTVCALKTGQCWGYAPRSIRGGTGWSNHASGTAIDLNASMFPQGQRRMTAAQVKACRAIVAESHGAIRWGGDYRAPTLVDQQHFEIASVAAARAFVARLKQPTQETEMQATDHMKVRDAYQASKGKPADRTLTVEQAIQTAYNYGSVAARDVAALKEQIAALTAQLVALKGTQS